MTAPEHAQVAVCHMHVQLASLHKRLPFCCRKKRRSKMAAAARDGSIMRSTSMDRVTSYGSFGGHSLDRTTSFEGSAGDSGSPRSASSFEVPFLSGCWNVTL